jgi:hypothetical protein
LEATDSIAGMKRKATITVETERLLIIQRSHQPINLWCRECASEVTMLGLNEAAALAGLSHRAIFQLAESHRVHFIETAAGKALFCVESLLRQTARARRAY